MTLQPTQHFRWLEREQQTPGALMTTTAPVLQQGWAPSSGGHVEWRDVPTVRQCAAPARTLKLDAAWAKGHLDAIRPIVPLAALHSLDCVRSWLSSPSPEHPPAGEG